MNTETLPKTTTEARLPLSSEDAGRRRVERIMLGSAIGLAGALLLLLLLGTLGVLQGRALQICGTVLVWLCAALIFGAVLGAMKYVART